jgi:hypothetical protein
LLPYWGSNHSFIAGIAKRTQPASGPLTFSTDPASDYYKSVLDVYNTVNNLTDEQKTIASFWDDNVSSIHPSGHSENILTQMIENTHANLFTSARAYALMGIAENDIFISCWKTKYNYVAVRPQTYIQTNINPTWVSYIATPPHPEYTAGHATESATASVILSNLFGANTPFTDHTHDIDGYAPRSFANFDAFAQEAAISRVYGGIHYRRTCQQGYLQGKKLAKDLLSKIHL